ncbi:uncharacterized protein TNCV_1398881 [Trichonephila clavipes]|nr:uncharacterized protein TNCV_1398881 [Trichonephila clavipes]
MPVHFSSSSDRKELTQLLLDELFPTSTFNKPHLSPTSQRKPGCFTSSRNYAMPIMMKAGKYLGKHLLSTGQNVLEDMSQGKSFKEAPKYQLRQVGEEIKNDILRKLKGGGGVKRKK